MKSGRLNPAGFLVSSNHLVSVSETGMWGSGLLLYIPALACHFSVFWDLECTSEGLSSASHPLFFKRLLGSSSNGNRGKAYEHIFLIFL